MNLTERNAPPKPEPRAKKSPKPIERRAAPSKRKTPHTLAIEAAIKRAKNDSRWRCRVTGKSYRQGDPALHGMHLLEGRRNNPSPRWDAANPDFILPGDAEVHRQFDLNKRPEDRARWLRERAGEALRDGRTLDGLELYVFAETIDWLTDMGLPDEARPTFAEIDR